MSWLVLAPMRSEARALRRGLTGPDTRILTTGVGPRRARRAAAQAATIAADAIAVAGVAGAVVRSLQVGDVVVADRLLRRSGQLVVECDGAPEIAARLAHTGLAVRIGPVVSVRNPGTPASRRALMATGALAVDMESAWLAAAAQGRPLTVIRVIMDTPAREWFRAMATLRGLKIALNKLTQISRALDPVPLSH